MINVKLRCGDAKSTLRASNGYVSVSNDPAMRAEMERHG